MRAVLETERLQLRHMTLEDTEALLRIWGSPEAMRFFDGPWDFDQMRAAIERNIQRYERDGHGMYTAVLKNGGDVAGDCGLVKQDINGSVELEVGYHMRPDLWGKGLATEAARGCMNYAFETLKATRIISMIRPENIASRRVAEKNGLTVERTVFWRGYQHCIYSIEQT
jgi:[ribosomal protein S5]-alanine N-acetyltransferase